MVKKSLCLCLMLVFLGCSTVPVKEPESLVKKASTAINTLTWIKGVTDTVFTVGCSSGQFPEGTCAMYQSIGGLAQVSLETARTALDNYVKSGTALNEELLMTALQGLSPYILKFDFFYKHPV